jgi:hypothetical protein
MTTPMPSPLAAMPLPSVQRLHDLMLELGCLTRGGWCSTHNTSLRIHDGGRVACAAAWEAAR